MPLRPIENQANEPIAAFFLSLAAEGLEDMAEPMLRLIKYLEVHDIGTDMWVFTSLTNLCFTPCDDYAVYVIRIAYIPNAGYRIDYAFPPQPLSMTKDPHTKTSLSFEQVITLIQDVLQAWRASGVTPRYEIIP